MSKIAKNLAPDLPRFYAINARSIGSTPKAARTRGNHARSSAFVARRWATPDRTLSIRAFQEFTTDDSMRK